MKDQVFCIWDGDGNPVWKIAVNGKIVAAEWRDKGSALAGMKTEQQRQKIIAERY